MSLPNKPSATNTIALFIKFMEHCSTQYIIYLFFLCFHSCHYMSRYCMKPQSILQNIEFFILSQLCVLECCRDDLWEGKIHLWVGKKDDEKKEIMWEPSSILFQMLFIFTVYVLFLFLWVFFKYSYITSCTWGDETGPEELLD